MENTLTQRIARYAAAAIATPLPAAHGQGMPARNGVATAAMVATGMTGVGDVLEGNPSFLTAFGVDPEATKAFDTLGSEYETTRTNIKRWSVGSPMQAALDALELLISRHGITAADVAAVAVHLPTQGAQVVNNRNMPSVNLETGGLAFPLGFSHAAAI
jgi:2-methylcitrate dehydratase PrpD